MANAKKKNNTSLQEKVFNRLLTDRRFRQEIVRKKLKYFFPIYFYKYLTYETAPFQEEIFRILEDEKNKLAILIAFRGSAKSTVVTLAYVLWSILGVQQKKYVVILGQTEQKARVYLMNIKKELEDNDLLKKDLGPFEEEKNQWGATALIISDLNAKIMISSVEQSIRGMRHGEHRPDLIILDDVEDIRSVKTQESRDKTFSWLTGEVIPAGDKNTRMIAVGNHLHEDSLLKRLHKKINTGEMDGIYREYPVIDENNNPLWPGKYPTVEDLEKEKRKCGSNIAWAREYLLAIISTEEQVIKPEWIKYYDDIPPDNLMKYIATGIDPAISKSDYADYTAMVSARIYGRKDELTVYIIPNIINKRLSFLETVEQAKLISNSLQRSQLYIEDVAYQSALVEQLKKDKYPVKAVKVGGQDKLARLSAVSHLVQSGKVLFPKEGANALITQLTGFGSEKYNDLVDAFSLLMLKIIERDNIRLGVTGEFKGEYNGEYDHLPPDERDAMMRKREWLRRRFLL